MTFSSHSCQGYFSSSSSSFTDRCKWKIVVLSFHGIYTSFPWYFFSRWFSWLSPSLFLRFRNLYSWEIFILSIAFFSISLISIQTLRSINDSKVMQESSVMLGIFKQELWKCIEENNLPRVLNLSIINQLHNKSDYSFSSMSSGPSSIWQEVSLVFLCFRY